MIAICIVIGIALGLILAGTFGLISRPKKGDEPGAKAQGGGGPGEETG